MASDSDSVLPPSDSDMTLTHAISVLLRRLQTVQDKSDSDDQIQLRTANEHLADTLLHYKAALFCMMRSADGSVDLRERKKYKALGEAYGRLCKAMFESPRITKPQDWQLVHQHLTNLDTVTVADVDRQTEVQKAANARIAEALQGTRPKGEVLTEAKEDTELKKVMEYAMGLQLEREQAEYARQLDDEDLMSTIDEDFAERTRASTVSSKKKRTTRNSTASRLAGGGEENVGRGDRFGFGFD